MNKLKIFCVSFFVCLFSLSGFSATLAENNNINFINGRSNDVEDKHIDINFTIPGLDNLAVAQQNKLGKFVPLTGNLEQMKYFFNGLKNSKNKIIRIAHYGDSLIQGDIITEYIREKLQERFGGKGVGYLNIVSNDIRMRNTTKHTFSNDWNYVSIITRNADNLPFGVSGAVAVPKLNSWVKYETSSSLKSSGSFTQAKIFYSNADESSTFQYTINGRNKGTIKLERGDVVREINIEANGTGNSIEIKFIQGRAPYIYGISLESGNGVYIDNFPMPGNSGVSLLEISGDKLSEFDKLMDYNLVILTYGANVNAPNKGIYNLYENKMITVINQFKKSFPNAGILLISVGDKTMKRGNKFITNPDVPILLDTQKRIVEKTNIAFWNLWEAMGGNNSMDEWVNSAPPMALKDYSHFTPIGGERVSQLLFEAILQASQRN